MSIELLRQELAVLQQRVVELEQDRDRIHQTLQEAQHKLRFFNQNAPLGVIEWNTAFEVTEWNTAAESIFGYSQSEALGRHAAGLIVPDSVREQVDQVFTALLTQTGGSRNLNQNVTKDGRIITCDWYNSPLVNLQGQVVGVISMVMDITDRRRAETELRASEAKLRALFAAMTDLVLVMDSEGRYIEIVPTAPSLLYRPQAALLGRCIHEVMPQEQADFLLGVVHQALQTQQTVSAEYSLCVGERVLWFDANVSPQAADQVVWVIRDITDRKQAELTLQQSNDDLEAKVEQRTDKLRKLVARLRQEIGERQEVEENLRKSQEILQAVIDTIPQFIFWKDRNSVYLGCNRNFARFAGVAQPSQIVGKTDDTLAWETEAAEFLRTDDVQVMTLDRPEIHRIQPQRQANGQLVWLDSSKLPLHDAEGEVVGILGMYEDITDRRQAEAALQQAKQDLEDRVAERTRELQQVIAQLEHEITERRATEAALRRSEDRFQKLSDNVPGVIYQFRLDAEGNPSLPYISSGCREIYGLEPEEIGQNAHLLITRVHPDDREQFEASVTHSAQTLQTWDWEGRILHQSGLVRWLRGAARPELQLDGSILWDGLLVDVTERKQAEADLRQTKEDLEQRVEERTAALRQIVVKLQGEIHDRQQAEAELARTQKFLKSVLDTLPVAVVAKEAEELRFALWNPAAEKLLGFVAEEVLGKNDYELFPREQAHAFVSQDRAVLNGRQIVDIPEEVIQTGTGEARILHTRKTTIVDTDGNPQYLLAITEDITERKQAEETLLRINKAVESTSDAIGMVDLEGQAVYLNPAFIELFGYSLEELNALGGPISLYPNPRQAQRVTRKILKGQSWRGEVVMRSRRGHTMQIELRADAIKDPAGNILGLIGSHTDITDRKRAQQALQASEAQLRQQAQDLEQALRELQRTQSHLIQSEKMSSLGQLVAGVAHEINNPVSFVYGNLTYANDYTQDLLSLLNAYQQHYPNPVPEIRQQAAAIDLDFLLEDLPKLLTSMRVGAERIQQIVASLRTFSRMDEAEFKAVNIHEGIDSTLMILHHRLKAKSMQVGNRDRLCPEIAISKHYGTLPLVECYAGQLNQVFMNILVNAIDALEEAVARGQPFTAAVPMADELVSGELEAPPAPTIHIRTELIQAPGNSPPNSKNRQVHPAPFVRVAIADNGPGMPDSVRQRLFDPFFTTKPVGKGTGMGLSISYQIVTERHNGSLYCISTPGQGAEFVIEIPLYQNRR